MLPEQPLTSRADKSLLEKDRRCCHALSKGGKGGGISLPYSAVPVDASAGRELLSAAHCRGWSLCDDVGSSEFVGFHGGMSAAVSSRTGGFESDRSN